MAPKAKEKPKTPPAQPPISIEDFFTSLNRHIDRSEYELAVKIANQVLAISPADEDAIQCKIVALVRADNINEALKVIDSSKMIPIDLNFLKRSGRSQSFFLIEHSFEDSCIKFNIFSEKYDSMSSDQDLENAAVEEHIFIILSKITIEEKALEEEHNRNIMLKQELSDARKQLNLVHTVKEDMKELQELTNQTSELEKKYAELGDKLQRKCVCPSCHQFNSGGLDGIMLLKNDKNFSSV